MLQTDFTACLTERGHHSEIYILIFLLFHGQAFYQFVAILNWNDGCDNGSTKLRTSALFCTCFISVIKFCEADITH